MKFALLAQHGPSDLVAFGGEGARCKHDLLTDAARVAAELPDASEGSHVLLVFKEDRYAFAVAALAAWSRGHRLALAPNTRRDAVWAILQRDDCVAMLHDTAAGSAVRVPDLLGDGGAATDVASAESSAFEASLAFTPEQMIATVYTSGTTGEMRGLGKTAGQLLGEAAMLAERFGCGADTRVASTVPPGHIYGLLFTVLVPLLSGGAFLRESPFHAESVSERVQATGANVLVTVPAHLPALEQLSAGALAGLRVVFSSTAPLGERLATDFAARHGVGVTEVFGSSETGGIATRLRAAGDAWQPLPGVKVSVSDEGNLRVSSPFVDPAYPEFETADLAELTPEGFEHRGRADGVVKIGGRRVSLPAMRALLMAHPDVQDVAVESVAAPGARGTRLLAALVAPELTMEAFRAYVGTRFEPSCVPRSVKFVSALPREDNGKLQRVRVLRLFGLAPSGEPLRWELEWDDTLRSEPSSVPAGGERMGDAPVETLHTMTVHVPETYGWYEGHFPGYPIMAGAVQLHEVVAPAVRRAMPDAGRIVGVRRLKFTDRILPGDTVTVELRTKDATAADFKLMRGTTTCAGGRLLLA